jgi:hypothetical protein
MPNLLDMDNTLSEDEDDESDTFCHINQWDYHDHNMQVQDESEIT